MISLIGYPFIFNGIPSELYNMSIVFINNDNTETPSGSGVELQTDTIFRNPEVLFMGAKQSPVLEFPLEIVCDFPMDVYKFHEVKNWLFSDLNFKPLQICIQNFNTFYFNCKLHAGKDYIYGDGYRGFQCTVECDSPWAWEFPNTKSWDLSESNVNTIKLFNLSADKEDVKPIVGFTMCPNTYAFSIVNKSYNNLNFSFSNLQNEESIVVDNKIGSIKSSTGLRRMGNFNKQYLKLKQGLNILQCTGNVSELYITYQNAIRLGGGFY